MVVAVVELTVTLGWPGAGSEKIVTFINTLLPPSMQYDVNTFTHYFTCSSSSASDSMPIKYINRWLMGSHFFSATSILDGMQEYCDNVILYI